MLQLPLKWLANNFCDPPTHTFLKPTPSRLCYGARLMKLSAIPMCQKELSAHSVIAILIREKFIFI